MSKRVLCIVADGVEETELIAPVDFLRRAGVEVLMASTDEFYEVTGKHGIQVCADARLMDLDVDSFDALLLPGGPAVIELRKTGEIAKLARHFAEAGKVVGAICAAPLLLQDAGLLKDCEHTAHFTTYEELTAADAEQAVVVDGLMVTSRGAGTSIAFGLALVAKLVDQKTADEIAKAIMV